MNKSEKIRNTKEVSEIDGGLMQELQEGFQDMYPDKELIGGEIERVCEEYNMDNFVHFSVQEQDDDEGVSADRISFVIAEGKLSVDNIIKKYKEKKVKFEEAA